MSKTHHLRARRAPGSFIWVLTFLAIGCGDRPSPSPTAPDRNPGGSSSPPAGQTHIRGSVSDTVRRPLPGALVAVLDGPLAGTTKLTDAEGKFELTGTAAGAATLRVSRDGFQTKTQSVLWRTPTSGVGVDGFIRLDTLEPPIGLDPGDYTLTIAIDLATAVGQPGIPKAPCAGFPVNLASFTYRVQILEGNYGRYVRDENRPLHLGGLFGFSVGGRFVGFEIDHGIPHDFPGFRFLNIFGVAPTSEPAIAIGSSLSIPFYGEFRYCELKTARGIYNDCSQVPAEQIVDYHSCTSDHATMVFTKR